MRQLAEEHMMGEVMLFIVDRALFQWLFCASIGVLFTETRCGVQVLLQSAFQHRSYASLSLIDSVARHFTEAALILATLLSQYLRYSSGPACV